MSTGLGAGGFGARFVGFGGTSHQVSPQLKHLPSMEPSGYFVKRTVSRVVWCSVTRQCEAEKNCERPSFPHWMFRSPICEVETVFRSVVFRCAFSGAISEMMP